MNWTAWLIAVPGVCYVLASLVYASHRNWPLSVVYAGYAIGQCGLFAIDRLQPH